MVAAAKNREQVVLVDGSLVTLVSWGVTRGRSRARVLFSNGRARTIEKSEVVGFFSL
jgi:hypothetical protein